MLEQDPSSGQRSEVTWISPQSFNGERYFWEMLRYSRFINHFNIFIWYFPFLFTGWRFSWRMEHQKQIWANREIVYQRNNFSSFLRPTNYLKKPAYSIKAVSLAWLDFQGSYGNEFLHTNDTIFTLLVSWVISILLLGSVHTKHEFFWRERGWVT